MGVHFTSTDSSAAVGSHELTLAENMTLDFPEELLLRLS